MIEKHQQTNGIGRGKITINPEYIKRAGEITVEGLPVKILSSNPNTGRVLAQFPDGHTEEVKAAPDYFIGGNTSTKELKNNLPIYGETNTAANERADSLDEAHDLTPIFANLMTAGQAPVVNEGAENIKKGNYLLGASLIASPLMFGSGAVGTAARSGIGLYNLANENGVRKTINNFSEGNYGQGILSLMGDAFNAAMASEGLGSISNALKGTSGYKNWRLAKKTGNAESITPKIQKGFNFNDLPQEKYVYNNKTGDFDVIAPKKEWIRKGEELTKEYFGEHLYDLLISRGFSPKDAAMVTSTRYYGTINAKPGVLRNLGKNTYGESLLLNEKTIQPVYNFRKHVPASLNDANTTLETVFHELGGHGSSFNILYGLPLKINEVDFIRLMKILDHNEKLRPKLKPFYLAVKDGDFKLAETLAPKDGTLKGINGEIDYKKLQDFIKYMEKNLEYTARAIATNMGEHYGLRKNGWNVQQLRLLFTDESVNNLLKNVWNYGIPVTAGGYTLYNISNQPKQLFYKKGGKMNAVEQFKNGSKIHIKKKNKGKFTDYCGGEVTQECIRKAKASGNPTLVKRATFVDNARHFKHKSGGKAFVEGVNVLDSNPRIYKYLTKIKVSPRGVVKKETGGSFVNNALNFINSDTGQSIIGGISNTIQGMSAKKKLNKAIDALKKAIDELYNVAKNNIDMGARHSLAQANLELKKALSPGIHFGEIDLGLEENKLKLEAAAKATNDANVLRDQALANLNNQASLMSNEVSNNITGNIGGLLNGAFQLAGNYFSNKTSNNSTTVKPGYTYSKIASNNFSVPKTNFSVNMKL